MFSIDLNYPSAALFVVGVLPHWFNTLSEDIAVEVVAQEFDVDAIDLVTDTDVIVI